MQEAGEDEIGSDNWVWREMVRATEHFPQRGRGLRGMRQWGQLGLHITYSGKAGSKEEFPPAHLFRIGDTSKWWKQKKTSSEKNNLLL